MTWEMAYLDLFGYYLPLVTSILLIWGSTLLWRYGIR